VKGRILVMKNYEDLSRSDFLKIVSFLKSAKEYTGRESEDIDDEDEGTTINSSLLIK